MATHLNSQHPVLTLGESVAVGAESGHAQIRTKIGYTSVTGATVVDIWNAGGSYTKLAAGQALEVVSSDNTNDKAGGTGALTVSIGYLTSAFVSKTAVVTLTGTAAAATTETDIMYVNSFRVATAGATGVAAGTITLRRASAGTKVSEIAAGQTRGRKMWYTVPAGKKYLITNMSWGSGAGSAAGKDFLKFILRANYDDISMAKSTIEYPFFEAVTVTGGNEVELHTPFVFPEGVTIRMVVQGNSATDAASCYASWQAILVDA